MNQHFGTTSERKETGAQLDLTKQQTKTREVINKNEIGNLPFL